MERRDILGLWIGLRGFPEAIEAVSPQAAVQTCIVHVIHNSMDFASWKDRKPVVAELRSDILGRHQLHGVAVGHECPAEAMGPAACLHFNKVRRQLSANPHECPPSNLASHDHPARYLGADHAAHVFLCVAPGKLGSIPAPIPHTRVAP